MTKILGEAFHMTINSMVVISSFMEKFLDGFMFILLGLVAIAFVIVISPFFLLVFLGSLGVIRYQEVIQKRKIKSIENGENQ